jgi:hypothetical protein
VKSLVRNTVEKRALHIRVQVASYAHLQGTSKPQSE